MLAFVVWEWLSADVTGRRSWLLALAILLAAGALMALTGDNSAAGQSPVSVPSSSDSAKAAEKLSQFPDGDRVSAILVITRTDGLPLKSPDLVSGEQARDRMQQVPQALRSAASPLIASTDAKAAIATVSLSASLSGFELNDTVKALRGAAADGLPSELTAHVTGGPAFGADIANAFSGANITLLLVTGLVVALLLIATYRSPVLWLVPLTVIGFADRVATVVGTGVADATGLIFDGSTSGITSVLVFGAGTNYALLLISRYREELRNETDHRTALRRAVRTAGPAIVASNATVVLALLTLILALIPSTRSLGACGACGLGVAAFFVLFVLPPLLALCGRRVFWPFIPRAGEPQTTTTGAWHRIADAVGKRPGPVCAVTVTILAALSAGLLETHIGLSQTEQFRFQAESVAGFKTLAVHFPEGASDPTVVIASTARATQVQQAIAAAPGVVSAAPTGESPAGLTKWSVIINAAPSTTEAFNAIGALRKSVSSVDPTAMVGGSDAQTLDIRDAAARDRLVLIPAILAVVLVVLYVLLRAVLAPPVLVAATVLSALAALGLGGWASIHVFGFPALDNSTPLFAFLFLVALGVDYTIFLVTRAREETTEHGTRDGMVRAVAATGGVITSAGIVLAAVFCVLGVLPLIVLTQLGIIVGLGILLDTFVVRTLVIPALFALIGDRIWWPTFRRPAGSVAAPTHALGVERQSVPNTPAYGGRPSGGRHRRQPAQEPSFERNLLHDEASPSVARSDDDTWDLASSVGATATMVAAGRAMATKRTRALINDPFAEPLVEAVGLDFFTKQVKGQVDAGAMNAPSMAFVQLMVDGIAVRTKYFDQYFLAAADAGLRQAVILASGLDARAYRLPWPHGTIVYEIDQPQVIEFKTAKLADLKAKPTAERRVVPIDLRDDWPAALRAAGLDTKAPTAWSAEGLLQYLPADAQNRLLDSITELSAPVSTIAADYNVGTDDFGQGVGDDVTETWREKGFTLDIPSLMFTGERSDVAEYLTALGWQASRRPVDELFASYGIERTRSAGNHPLDNVVYVRAILRRSPGSTD